MSTRKAIELNPEPRNLGKILIIKNLQLKLIKRIISNLEIY